MGIVRKRLLEVGSCDMCPRQITDGVNLICEDDMNNCSQLASVDIRDLKALESVAKECIKLHKEYGALPQSLVAKLKINGWV